LIDDEEEKMAAAKWLSMYSEIQPEPTRQEKSRDATADGAGTNF
jgi:hypothetical protein